MSAIDKQAVEARLDERAEQLRRLRQAMRRGNAGMVSGELSHLDNHPGDAGSATHDMELDETTGIFLDEEERRIGEARRALERGTYGTCVSCGRPISPARLQAVPDTVRCIGCQRGFEGSQRQANARPTL